MMLRQVSSRSQRGKGNLKLQKMLQISLLVAFCIWLLYQMEHSHDKKKSYSEIIKSKVGRSPFNIIKFSRKYGVGRGEVLEEDEEEEGGAGGHAMDGVSPRKESDAFEEKDREEASQKAREMSFKGDDASSEVIHIVHEEEEEEEHEGGSHEARERSFKADDASSAVAHVPQANELDLRPGNIGGIRNQAENGSENSGGQNSIIVRERSKAIHSSNATEVECKATAIVLSKNSTSSTAGISVFQNKTAVAVAFGDGLNRAEAHGDGKLSFEKGVMRMKQKADDTIGRAEKSEEM